MHKTTTIISCQDNDPSSGGKVGYGCGKRVTACCIYYAKHYSSFHIWSQDLSKNHNKIHMYDSFAYILRKSVI